MTGFHLNEDRPVGLRLNRHPERRNFLQRIFIVSALLCAGGLAWLVVPPANAHTNQFDPPEATAKKQAKTTPEADKEPKELETVTLGAGCFWCVEAIFQRVKGVESVVSGYMGGQVKNPTYKQVLTGMTGHAEVCQIQFDPDVISFDEILEVFWKTHDPTTLNQQGPDFGTQYRSAIFYSTDEQREIAEKYKTQLNQAFAFGRPIVTEIVPEDTFYRAEDYHQNYFNTNSGQNYCRAVIAPKIDKFKKTFHGKTQKTLR